MSELRHALPAALALAVLALWFPLPEREAGPPPAAPAEPTPEPPSVSEAALRPRETLEVALARAGLERDEAALVVAALEPMVNLRRLAPGERVRVSRPVGGDPDEVAYWRSPLERYELRREDGRWVAVAVKTPVESRVAAISGELRDSLFASMDRLGESATLTARLVSLFEWDFDFAADSLPGDRFRLLVEKRFAGETFVGYGDILVAQYVSRGRAPLTAVGWVDGEGRTAYFDAKGRSVKKAFLRAPLDFTRITSGFSHARVHPILGGVRPHLAVDYGAPVGTPVRAVADGVVEVAGWAGGNGISITLRHAQGYKTQYNHLSRAEVRAGQRVMQRHIIARVGATGLATGPHLDYRVMRNGAFVNPLQEKFIPGAPVPSHRLGAFRGHLESLLKRLDREGPLPGGRQTG
ncbi:MAG TPA: M23 family metallopeptidase [Methylomirabilota bacterium]|nr:M23 family metallopeptidase [Methylomirabilota bacterium]